MAYHHIDTEPIEPSPDRPSVQRAIGDAASLEDVAVTRYEEADG